MTSEAYDKTLMPARFHVGDFVTVANPVRWGLPYDFDTSTRLHVEKESFATVIGWTATVKVGLFNYEIYESDLEAG